ncbi:protein O-glucosyltransferase 3 isoform X2 [Equus quagga]|uniref:protein O-glucosyltransferase 3 isoform X2 n=1 Tax=Equus quagga TaxID=89248 RepID=UPI001EE3010F|nr:protein O-glucosyltransferase 3 isoform X2 [Equus quagga]
MCLSLREAGDYPAPLRSGRERAGAGTAATARGPAPGWAQPRPRRSWPLPAAAELDRSGPATMRRLPRALLLPLPLALLVAAGAPEAPVSAPRSLVWGPGLQAGVVLPVRYFYLQAVTSEGQNLTRSPPGQTLFKVVIKSLSPKELVRIHIPKPLDRNDGTFLMRYRMYETVNEGLKIEVLYGDEHVAQSPYILKGPVYHEYCECPEEDPQAWQKTLSCPTKEPQIAKDFASFPSINLQQMLNEVPKRFGDERGAIVHYTILNNHIYRRSLGKYTDFKMFSDEILLSLARKYKYQVNVDGTVAAYRYPYLMLGDSLVLKQDSPYYEHFYLALKPWKHYVPIKRNLSDLLEKVKWAKENDGEAKKIAKEGQLTARELLQPHRLYCYYYRVLQKYAERQSSKPEIRDGMELVPQPKDNESICQCHRKRPLREEL